MINEISIINYIISIFLGIVAGIFTAIGILKYSDEESIFSKELFKELKFNNAKLFISLLLNVFIYLGITYTSGNIYSVDGSINIIKLTNYISYLMVTPLLLITIFTNIENRIIPNRIIYLLFEIGILKTVLVGLINAVIFQELLVGMLISIILFGGIALIGKMIVGKEAMGLDDVKFMVALGLILGKTNILNIIILAFAICVLCSIILLIKRKIEKDDDQYIPLAPYLSLSTLIIILIPTNYILQILLNFGTKIADKFIGG